jgi:hypothetical protein
MCGTLSDDSAVNKDTPTAQITAVSFFIGNANESINRSINWQLETIYAGAGIFGSNRRNKVVSARTLSSWPHWL